VKVLIAGGAGFVGSTVASACLDSGIVPVILDNLVTGRPEFTRGRVFYRGDIRDGAVVDRIFADHPEITTVIHTATVAAWPTDTIAAERLADQTVADARSFLGHVVRNGARRFLFSSSADICCPDPDRSVHESSVVQPTTPYTRAKAEIEAMLAECARAGGVRALSLRYLHPIGADPQLRTGPHEGRPAPLVDEILAAARRGEEFVLSGDLPTRDGSAIQDFVHVWDIADAHVAAVQRFDAVLPEQADWAYDVINLGTGRNITLKEFVAAVRRVAQVPVRVREVAPGPGEPVGSFTRSVRARDMLGWTPRFTVLDGIRHALEWAAARAHDPGQTPVAATTG